MLNSVAAHLVGDANRIRKWLKSRVRPIKTQRCCGIFYWLPKGALTAARRGCGMVTSRMRL